MIRRVNPLDTVSKNFSTNVHLELELSFPHSRFKDLTALNQRLTLVALLVSLELDYGLEVCDLCTSSKFKDSQVGGVGKDTRDRVIGKEGASVKRESV